MTDRLTRYLIRMLLAKLRVKVKVANPAIIDGEPLGTTVTEIERRRYKYKREAQQVLGKRPISIK